MKWTLLFVVCLAAAGRCLGDDAAAAEDTVKTWAQQAEHSASEAMQDAKDTAGSWKVWAFNKLQE